MMITRNDPLTITRDNVLDLLALGDVVEIETRPGRVVKGQIVRLAKNLAGEVDLAIPGHGFTISPVGMRYGGHFSLKVTKV